MDCAWIVLTPCPYPGHYINIDPPYHKQGQYKNNNAFDPAYVGGADGDNGETPFKAHSLHTGWHSILRKLREKDPSITGEEPAIFAQVLCLMSVHCFCKFRCTMVGIYSNLHSLKGIPQPKRRRTQTRVGRR